MQLLKHFKELTVFPKNVKELNQLFVELALKGKLTKSWRSNNSSQNGLEEYDEIKKITPNKLSDRDKTDLEEQMSSFKMDDFPTTWGVGQLADVASFWNGKAHESVVDEDGDYNLVNSRFVSTNGNKVKKVTEIRSPLSVDDIAIVMSDVPNGRALSRCYLVYENDKFTLNQRIGGVTPLLGISPAYLALVLDRNKHFLKINDGRKQTNLKRIHMLSCIVPFPPLEEQKAIVATVNQLFKEVEVLEEQTKARVQLKEDFVTSALQELSTGDTVKEWSFLQEHFKTFFTEKTAVKKLRESILQLAVQGKLTKHWRSENPDVEPASVLLEKIKAEKAQLIKDKKIKAEKPLPEITKEEIPYELPEGWSWCRLTELVDVGTGSTPSKSDLSFYEGGTIPWYTSSATNDDFAKVQDVFINQKAIDETNCKIFPSGSLIIAMYGQGKTRGQISELVTAGATNQAIAAMVFFESSVFVKQYLKSFFEKYYHEIRLLAEGGAQPNLNVGKIKATLIPLPPQIELDAIVEKVNALMGLCDSLEKEIDHSTTQVEQLMQSCLKEVFEGGGGEAA